MQSVQCTYAKVINHMGEFHQGHRHLIEAKLDLVQERREHQVGNVDVRRHLRREARDGASRRGRLPPQRREGALQKQL